MPAHKLQGMSPQDWSVPKGSRVAVVGAGVAGLQTAAALLDVGLRPVVLEAGGAAGGVWADNYEDFGAQVPVECYQFVDYPISHFAKEAHEGVATPWKRDEYRPGSELQVYIREYVRSRPGLAECLRFRTRVVRIEPRKDGWAVTTEPAGAALGAWRQSTEAFAAVVVCTGQYITPNMPAFAGADSFRGRLLHSSEFLDASVAAGKRVVVIGAGKSAYDVAIASVKRGAASVDIVSRTPRWAVPRHVFGLIPIKYFAFTRLGYAAFPPAYLKPGGLWGALRRGELSALLSAKRGLLWPLAWLYFRFMELVIYLHLGVWAPNRIEEDLANAGGQVLTTTPKKLMRSGALAQHVAGLRGLSEGGVVLANGKELEADIVIAATGFKKDHTGLEQVMAHADIEKDGAYLYKQTFIPTLPRIAFVGSEVASFTHIVTAFLQAQVVAAVLSRRLELPSVAEMRAEIALWKQWKRGIPFTSERAAKLQVHFHGYHDDLVKTLGFNHRRKRTPWGELLSPYLADDYAEVKAANLPVLPKRAATFHEVVTAV